MRELKHADDSRKYYPRNRGWGVCRPVRRLPGVLLIVLSYVVWGDPAPEQQDPKDIVCPKSAWDIKAGAMSEVSPTYPGSKEASVWILPHWDVEYENLIFSQDNDVLGAYLVKSASLEVGAGLQYDWTERLEKSDARLIGLGDVNRTVRSEAYADYTVSPCMFTAALSQDVAGQSEGLLATFDAACALPPVKRWTFMVGPGATWGDRQYTKTFFGVTPEQSSRSGMPVFAAHSGFADAHFRLQARYAISGHWSVAMAYEVAHLLGSAADSPITETRMQQNCVFCLEYGF